MKQKLLRSLEKKNPLLAFGLLTGGKKEVTLSDFLLPKKETVALYVVGLGKEDWQEKIIKWLKGDQRRKLYLIPESPYLLNFLKIELLDHPRMKLGGDVTSFAWDHLYDAWELMGGRSEVKEELADAILGVELTLSLYRDFGIPQLSNVITNLKKGEDAKRGEALAGKFQGIPAVICAAGPSLEKSLEEIKKVGDQAIIFGGGSALGPLARASIPIHFMVAIDPEPPAERFFRQTYFETPLFYQNQVASTLLNTHQGPKLCLGESGSFLLEKWLTEGLHLSSSDAGWNVSTFATYIATLLGCNPIYFVGMDLSVSKEASYVAGVEGVDERKNPIYLTDRFGNNVATRPDFLMAKKWLEEFAERHLETDFINASGGGLELEGIPYGDLKAPSQTFDLSSKIHQTVTQTPSLDVSLIEKKLYFLDQSLINTSEIIEKYLEGLSLKKNVTLYECELDEEIFYQAHLLPIWEVWKYLIQNDTIIAEMENPILEKKLQQIIFYQELTKKFSHERKLSI